MIRQDIRFALRMLRKSPAFTLTAVLVSALGIGGTTAIFTVVRHVLLQPLPFPDPAAIVDVNEYANGVASAVSPPNFMDWRVGNQTLLALSAYNEQVVTLSGGGDPQRAAAAQIDPYLRDVIRIQPLLGRAFTADDMRPGARRVALVGYGLWQRAFGSDPAMIGRQITLEGEPYEVSGVMPPHYEFPDGSEVWLPLRFAADDLNDRQRGAHYLNAVARLRPGITAAQASADLDRIEQRIASRFPERVGGYAVVATPLLQSIVGPVQRPLVILFGAVAFVLLIACVNVSNLQLARATTRTGELAVRAALGAGRRRLIRHLLAESVILSLAGGAAGLVLAWWGIRGLMSVAPTDLPRAGTVQMDAGILLFSVALSIVAGILFGTVPAIVASRPDLTVFLRDAGRDGTASGGRRRLRAMLVTAQVAIALVLLAGAGLAIRSFDRLTHVNPGFDPGHVLTFDVSLPEATYPSLTSQAQFFRDFTARLQQIPGVVSAGAVSIPPVTSSLAFGGSFTISGRPKGEDEGHAQVRSMTPGYLEALSIPLKAGRRFTSQDSETAARVALVSESAARRFWPGENPVGRYLRVHVNEPSRAMRLIVGVVGDVRTAAMDVDPVPVIYVPHTQYGPETMTLVIRGGADPLALLPKVESALHSAGHGVAMSRTRPMADLVAATVAEPRFRTLVLSVFAVVSLALAAVGLYGVVAFSVSQRRGELGLRIALGAEPRGLLRLVLREGMTPVVGGMLLGFGGAALAARVMKTLLFGIDPLDPITFGAVGTVIVCVALAACYVPARRAMQVEPANMLR